MKIFPAATLALVLVLAACSKKHKPLPTVDVNAEGLNLSAIEDVGRGFQVKHHRYATNVEELVNEKYITQPVVPPGKKITINPDNGEVRLE